MIATLPARDMRQLSLRTAPHCQVGRKQRIALARAFFGNPRMVVSG